MINILNIRHNNLFTKADWKCVPKVTLRVIGGYLREGQVTQKILTKWRIRFSKSEG